MNLAVLLCSHATNMGTSVRPNDRISLEASSRNRSIPDIVGQIDNCREGLIARNFGGVAQSVRAAES